MAEATTIISRQIQVGEDTVVSSRLPTRILSSGGLIVAEEVVNNYANNDGGARVIITVRGNTYHHKDQLKSLGGIWDPSLKAWTYHDNGSRERIEEYVKNIART